MKEYLRTFAKVGVALFCLWHMAAVGLYALPDQADDRVTKWLADHAVPVVTPYVLVTGQWQQWNLFAPNPLRRIVFYKIETRNPLGDWSYVASVNDSTYGPWRHAARFKLLGQALEENTARPELAERAAQVFCDEFGLQPDAPIRIWPDVAVVPYVYPSPSKAWWDSWKPTFQSYLALDTTCVP